MSVITVEANEVVSARVYALILMSKRLKRMLLPEGLVCSPYEILDYRVTLVLHDTAGMRATFERVQEVRFLQAGVAGVLDHAWGTGVVITSYHNDAGTLEDSFADQGRRHMVIALKRPMAAGETLRFNVARTTMACFAQEQQQWMETTIDHPIRRMSVGVLFPRERPVRSARLHLGDDQEPLRISRLADGRTVVRLRSRKPHAHQPYLIRWVW